MPDSNCCIEDFSEPCGPYQDSQAKSERLRNALKLAREKIILYRTHSNGEYQGGMEYGALIRLIDEALNQ